MLHLLNQIQKTEPYIKTAEEELLILCLQRSLKLVDREPVSRLLRDQVNWEYFLALTTKHAVSGLVHQVLITEFKNEIPGEPLKALESATRALGNYSLYLLGELLNISAQFRDNGIEFLPLKGPVLALTVYDSTYLRPYTDLDLLIKKRDLALAQQLLIAAGYTIFEEGHVLPQVVNDLGYNYHTVFVRRNNNIQIELHWGLITSFDLYRVDVDDLWKQLVSIQLNGVEILSLPPRDQLLMLSLHGAKHRWGRLKWLYDIAIFVRKQPDLDWSLVIEEAHELHIKRILLMNLWLTHIMLNQPLPKEVADQIQHDSLVKPLCAFAERWTITGSRSSIEKAKYVIFYFDARETWSDKISYLIQYLIKQAKDSTSSLIRASISVVLFLVWALNKVTRHL